MLWRARDRLWHLREFVCHGARVLEPPAPVEFVSAGPRVAASPLLEEERDDLSLAGVPDIAQPCFLHRSGSGPTLAARDDPVDSRQVEFTERPEQWFEREKADRGVGLLEVAQPP